MPQQAEVRARGFRWRAYAILLTLLLTVGVGGVTLVQTEADRLRQTAEADNFRLAVAGSHAATHGLQRTLEAVTSMQALAASLVLSHTEAGSVERRVIESLLVETTRQERFGILQVALIGPDGWLAWSTVPGFVPVDLSDREHIRVFREGGRDAFVSAPLVGRASQRWSLQVASPVLTPRGEFVGVTVVSVDPLALSANMGELQFAEGVTVNLLREDGVILARSGDPRRLLGMVRGGPDLARMVATPAGQMLTVGPLSGRPIFLAWRRLVGWPMLVAFSIDAPLAMQDVAGQRREMYVLLLTVLVALAVGGLLVVELRARGAVREALRQAEASREQVSHLLDALPGAAYRGLVASDGDLTRLHLSPAIARITGWPEERFSEPGSFTSLIDEEFRTVRRQFYVNVRQVGHDTIEYRVLGADGMPVWVRDECRVVHRLLDGRVEVVGLISDITAERTLKAQAISSAKLATLGEMATGVAHELNQPCAAITLAADIAALELEQGGADRLASARRRLDEIARQTMRMRGVIDHFRIFARTDDGEEGAVDLAGTIQGALSIAGGTLRASGVRVTTTMAEGLPAVRGSLVALEQVLVNLLVNARDAMEDKPEAERRVEISCVRTPDGEEVLLTLRDHGTGLPAEVLERSFEPFFTTKPAGKGTGLGLSIAYGTIRGFGGSIALRNHPEGGAQAEIRLRVAHADAAEQAGAEAG